MTNHTHTLKIDDFLPHMRDVIRCEQSLHELNLMWRIIEASAKMNCPAEAKAILPTMAATREGFNRLEQELVLSLVRQKVSAMLHEIGSKAQYVIDIVVRNLYERTADVGFLATDSELCAFVAGITTDADATRFRLRAYRNKYTVYDEIILLDVAGNVLVQIDEQTPLEGSLDPLIRQTLASETYVETFRASDLRPDKERALIYSRRMLHPQTGAVVGVLCLCFHFEQEMAGIFESYRCAADRFNMLLLDRDNRVIASADERWVPIGAMVPVNKEGLPRLMVYGGREYLVSTFAAEGYQGYKGPTGWQGQVMIAADVAFTGASSNALASLDSRVAEGLLTHARSFCPPLYEIMTAAETIRRVVWNGQVMTSGQRGELQKLKTILEQISETGDRSNALFAQSIRDLYETVLGSSLLDAEFVSHLLVDLLDRNLYERSDDCRWWALSPGLRRSLATPQPTPQAVAGITEILTYINQLYTVYTRLFVYDRDGIIIASTDSQPGVQLGPQHRGASVIGTCIEQSTLDAVRALRTEQDYYVTPFVPSALYGDAPTYVYHAAIRHPENDAQIVGGIGIVFDAGPEFSMMLKGALRGRDAISAFYIDRKGNIISSTDPTRPVGTILDLAPELLALPNGRSASRIVIHDGCYAILGCTVSSGYREFKVSDGYQEDILAVLFNAYGEVHAHTCSRNSAATVLESRIGISGGREFATFFVQGDIFALPAACVQQALPAAIISSVSVGRRNDRVGVIAFEDENDEKKFAWVFDLSFLIRARPSVIDNTSQVIIVRHGDHIVGLLVDELHGVPEFPDEQVISTPLAFNSDGLLIQEIIKANGGELLIQAIDTAQLFALLKDPGLTSTVGLNQRGQEAATLLAA